MAVAGVPCRFAFFEVEFGVGSGYSRRKSKLWGNNKPSLRSGIMELLSKIKQIDFKEQQVRVESAAAWLAQTKTRGKSGHDDSPHRHIPHNW